MRLHTTILCVLFASVGYLSCEDLNQNEEEPKACFSYPDSIYVAQPAVFDATCSENAETYLWTFGEGQTAPDSIVNITFTNAGDYDVTLRVTNGDQSDEKTRTVNVLGTSIVEVDGDIDVNTTWYADSIYLITRIIDVDAVLTIQPGTVVKMKGSMEIRCKEGTIKAIGTSDTPIVFTSFRDDAHGGDTNGDGNLTAPAKGDWNYISLEGQNNQSEFTYCRFFYGGGHQSYDVTLKLESGNSQVKNCTFAHNIGNESGALNAKEAENGTVITGNTFYDNGIPLVISGAFDVDASNVFHNPGDPTQTNTKNGIFFTVYNGNVEGNRSWAETEVPFVVYSAYGLTVEEGESLTLEPGVIVKFKEGNYMKASGLLLAEGNSSNPIVFTSYRDDAHGGDTDGNGSTITPSPGDWEHTVILGTNNASKMDYCAFYYGGGHNSVDYTLALESNNSEVTNCTFAKNDGDEDGALNAVDAGSGTVITGNTFYENVIPLAIGGQFDIDNSNVFHKPSDETVTNTKNGIFFMTYNGDIEGHRSWTETEVPFVVYSSYDLSIDEGHSLTLGEQVILKFKSGLGISYIPGTLLNYDGDGVWFTSFKDDAKGGDTNGDGDITSPAEGDWKGIYEDESNTWETWSNILYDEVHE